MDKFFLFYLSKGSLVAVEGRIQTGKYNNQEGVTVYTTDIVADDVRFLDSRGSRREDMDSGNMIPDNKFSKPQDDKAKRHQDPFDDTGKTVDISEDDLPF